MERVVNGESDSQDHLTGYIEGLSQQGLLDYYLEASQSLEELLNYPFQNKALDGEVDPRFKGVERIDIFRDKLSRMVRSPLKFLTVVRFIEKTRGRVPSIGLRYKEGSVMNYIHFLFEESNEGWIYIDNERMLQVRQIHKIEKIKDYVGLNRIGLVANKIGLPARNEVSRVNDDRGTIIDLYYFDSLVSHKLNEYF